MIIESLPDLNPPAFGLVVDPGRPIVSFSWTMDRAHRAAAHRHPRGHVIHPVAGAYWVTTTEGTWLVSPGQALWIPPNVHHEIHAQGAITARMIFVDPAHASVLPQSAGTMTISPFMEELLIRACEYGNDYALDSAAGRLALVMLDELSRMAPAPLFLPATREPRLAHVMARMIARPDAGTQLDDAGHDSGASSRTLARLFRQETGMSFSQWKTRLLLIESMERLSRGASITQVALDLGYGSTSSFVYMFRCHMGVPPGKYRPPGP